MFSFSTVKNPMTKALSLLSALLLCAGLSRAWAQNNPAATAEEELVRRQEKAILLRKTIEAAQLAQKEGDLHSAAKLYEDAWKDVEFLGAAAEKEREITVAGLSEVRIALAKAASTDGDYKEADVQLSRVLKVDPHNLKAIELKKENDRNLASMIGRTPSEETLKLVPEYQTNSVKAA